MVPMMTRAAEKRFLVEVEQEHRELSRRQREYKKVISLRLKTRYEQILDRTYFQAINRMKVERKELAAQIFVADGRCHQDYDQRCLEQIECHVECQKRMGKEIKELKTRISNVKREMGRVDKEICELNQKVVPDSQHQDFVARARKRIVLLQNRLEVGIRRECRFRAENSALQEELKGIIKERSDFHDSYSKLVQKLNDDKKFLVDLIEYVCNTYDRAIDIHEKMENVKVKITKNQEHTKLEMQSVGRSFAAAELANVFMHCKNQTRILADLQPSEFKRRANFKRNHVHKITLYNNVLGDLYDFANSFNVDTVIQKYQHQESLYYSFFSLANELSFHITLMQNAANRLFADVTRAKIRNRVKLIGQKVHLAKLMAKLDECKGRNQDLKMKSVETQLYLEKTLQGIAHIFNLCLADAGPLMKLLGNQTYVNFFNAHAFLKVLEMRILNIVRNVYIKERNDVNKPFDQYVVKELINIRERPTVLDDIVLTQQCPECAKEETFNVDDGDVAVLDIEETRKAVSEKVNQPDMQYQLHSVSECRLPKSRLLVAKRND